MLEKKIAITGGGSGGHISAATAIIDGLKEKYPNTLQKILYIGGDLAMEGESNSMSMEEKLIGSTDIPYISIRAGKLQRYFSIRSIKLLKGIVGGYIDAVKVLKEFKPDLLISTGGYVTVPVCLAAWRLKIPVYIHEQTAGVGLTNKITGKVARRIYVSFQSSIKYFNPGKTLHVGNPVRPQIFDDNSRGEIGKVIDEMISRQDKHPILLIAGGGQGSHVINLAVSQMLRYAIEDYQIILQTGDNKVYRDYDLLIKEKGKLAGDCSKRFYPTKYIDASEIGHVFNNIDMFIGRSGANFVYEMGVLKIPSLFIPIPWVTNDEQNKNAETLKSTGLARILPEGELTAERLFKEINDFIKPIQKDALNINRRKIDELFPTNAVDSIIEDLPI